MYLAKKHSYVYLTLNQLLFAHRALHDMKLRSVDTERLLEICPGLDSRLSGEFDDMLWKLMQNAADKTHLSMEPWYSCLDPNLPNFQPVLEEEVGDNLYQFQGGSYVKAPSKGAIYEQKMKEDGGFMAKLFSFFETSVDEKRAKGETLMLNVVLHEAFSNVTTSWVRTAS